MLIYLETYGCSANLNNAEIIRGLITQAGLDLVTNEKLAELIILNTCIVKSPTENKIKSRIIELEKLNKPIIITGCMPDVRFRELQRKNIYLLSNKNIKQICNLIKSIQDSSYNQNKFLIQRAETKLNLAKINENKKIGITQISEGCLGECNYCITRFAKGKLFSYSQEDIIKNIEQDIKNGCKEIWITSQDNASYGLDDKNYKLPDLLKRILEIEGKFRIRLGMMNPNNILPILSTLIEIYQDNKMYKYLHIPIQSASNKILKSMNRFYKKEDFLKIVKEFKSKIPEISIATDVIVGYPGETEKDFIETYKLIESIQPDQLNVNRYWAIKGTKAALEKQTSSEISKKRAEKLMKLYSRSIRESNKRLLNSIQKSLVYDHFNNHYLARTQNYKLVTFKSEKNLLGKIVNLKIIKTEQNHLVGAIQ